MPTGGPFTGISDGGGPLEHLFTALPQGTESMFGAAPPGFMGGFGGSGGSGSQGSALRSASPPGSSRRSSGIVPEIGPGGGDSGAPNYSRQGFASPGDINASTEVDPREGYAYDRARDYESGLASGTNEEITRELQRARDDLSTGLRAEGEAAMGRGADAGLFRTRALESGKRDIHNLQGRLADVALGRRGDAIRTLTGAAGQAASGQRSTHFGSLAARLADQRYQLDAAESQARLNQAPYDRMMRMMDSVGRYRGMLGSGGSGIVSGGGGGGFGASRGRRPTVGGGGFG